jgi:hypothetical protein
MIRITFLGRRLVVGLLIEEIFEGGENVSSRESEQYRLY